MHIQQPCKNLSPQDVGPFTIEERINPVTYCLHLPPEHRIHPTFYVFILKPYHSPLSVSTQPGPRENPPPSILVEDIYSRRRGGRIEYLMDWEGCGPEERSWVLRDDILDPVLMS